MFPYDNNICPYTVWNETQNLVTNLNPGSGCLVLGLRSCIPLPFSWPLGRDSRVSHSRSWVPVHSVTITKYYKNLLQRVICTKCDGIRKCDRYLKVWQKVITKCDRFYKVWQEVITNCDRYYKEWQLLQNET